MIEVAIQNGNEIFIPIVEEGLTWETSRCGSPGKVNFSITGDVNIKEGNSVSIKVDGHNLFYGFIFSMKYSKETIAITAYDQLRYFKNKETYVYKNKTASELLNMVSRDFRLSTGDVDDTCFKIKSRIEDGKTLFDIIQTALDITLQNINKMFVLYDDFGHLTLKNIETMKLSLLIDDEVVESIEHTSSIDGATANKVKLTYDNKDTGKREIYIAKDSSKINAWGVLQFYGKVEEGENGKIKADSLLKLYNRKSKTLKFKNAFGDVNVRAGTSIMVKIKIKGIEVNQYMLVEKVKHLFKESNHTMNLTLAGGEYTA